MTGMKNTKKPRLALRVKIRAGWFRIVTNKTASLMILCGTARRPAPSHEATAHTA